MGFVGTVSGDTPKSGAHQQQRVSTQVKGRSRAGGQAGRPAPGTRATGGGGTASTGPVLAIPNGRSFAPGTERFSRWRTAGSRERPSIWRSGRWLDPGPGDQQRRRDADKRVMFLSPTEPTKAPSVGFVGAVSGDAPKSGAHQQQRISTQVKGRSAAGDQAGGLIPCREVSSDSGSSFAPSTGRFSRWRTAGSRERPSI